MSYWKTLKTYGRNLMSTNPKKKWRCDGCGRIHEFHFDARYCCQPNVTWGYVCPTCETFYIEEETAIACCQDESEAPPTPTAQELEAAGQARLLP